MDTGEELKAWLTDKEKTFAQRVDFALKVWQSVDFSYPSKYEIIVKWLAKSLKGRQNVPVEQLQQLYELRSQPGLVSVDSKCQLMEVIIKKMSLQLSDGQITLIDLKLIEGLINSDLNQDALRANSQVLMMAYGILFQCYQKYALDLKPQQTGHEHHGEYIVGHLKQLREYAQRAQRQNNHHLAYDQWVIKPLVELLLHLKLQLTFFEDLSAVEKQYTEPLEEKEQIERLGQQDIPLHVRLYCLEAAIYNHRYEFPVLSEILNFALATKGIDRPDESLALAAQALDSLRRHDISIDFKQKKTTAFNFIAAQLLQFVRLYKESHLKQVIRLVCSALQFNPLLVEDNVYQITIWLMTTIKQGPEEEQLYSEYLVQLMNIIRRLSRAERFIMQLLKTLKEWLGKYPLPVAVGTESNPKKRKLDLDNSAITTTSSDSSAFLKLIFEKSVPSYIQTRHDPFQQLNQTWPSHSAGAAFTKLISQLMTKPSLVIWKTLLHSFSELLADNSDSLVLPENLDFARELHAALLSQYLLGTRLAEQVHHHQLEIEQQLDHTGEVLKQFGLCLLAQEHNRRQMNAFLECTERASALELLVTHYWPDGHKLTERPMNLHSFLSHAEWTLIQQRVHNFGKSSCRQRLQRLELQMAESKWLQGSSSDACSDDLAQLVRPQQLKRLSLQQKQLRIPMDDEEYVADSECLELHCIHLIQKFVAEAKESKKSKGSLLIKLKLDEGETSWSTAIREQHKKEFQLPSALELVATLQKLPLNQLGTTLKFRIWLILFALHCDLSADSENQTEVANQVLEQLIDMMHFGQPLPICTHLPLISEMLNMVTTSTAIGWKFYESLFARCIRRQAPGSENFLISCIEYLQEQMSASGKKLPTEQCRLLLLAIETLSGATGAQGRRLQQRQLQPLLEIYGQLVNHKFRSTRKDALAYKEFVDLTLGGYATYVTSCINRKPETEPKDDEIIDDNFRRICKIYIGHSVNYRNAHAIRLLNVALSHRQRLHLDSDEIEFVLSSYWRQLNDDINSMQYVKEEIIQNLEPAIKLIIGYKTNEDFFLLLKHLSSQMNENKLTTATTNLSNVLTLMGLFAKCSLSNIKGAMLNEHFELICVSASLRLPVPSHDSYARQMLLLLEAQRSLASNRTVPLTGETLDCLLGTMLDVNIKRYLNAGGNWPDFVQLFASMTDNLMVLLRQHNALMSDRAAQMTALCQDLVQAIVCYRCERKQAHDLSETELDGLGELGLKLATVMATMATSQALAVKRVAPFLLIFTIKQMVATERPTTLFEKVKVHVVRVCHELIGLCDHRSGHFILRASSEAGARMYESLVKDHQKYHKFRGKV
ncbi:uncharacterized protein LOC6652975 [Drosophila willistoni]|uniref:uncharacterized protein LOC6652975 n=1 Tax=Drosophila willistoni TaxID=7260 RepID=UPI001F07DBAF|nr:uncharacterized protein LOC6652975 [Drosophila willistoni]